MKHLKDSTYNLQVHLYFDLINGNPGAFTSPVFAKIFRKKDDILMQSIFLTFVGKSQVEYYNDGCQTDGIGTIRYTNAAELILSPEIYYDPDGYYIAWESCCRNYIIDNIFSARPDDSGVDPSLIAGQTFYLEFPPVVKDGKPFINSSVSLFTPISDYACSNLPFWFDFSGLDPDGDSLVYSMVTPLGSNTLLRGTNGTLEATTSRPYPNVKWKGSYSINNIMGGLPDLKISHDGFLSVTPITEGLFVFSVKCEEYRDGEKIGELRRDYQLYVIDECEAPESPSIKGKAGGTVSFMENELSVSFNSEIPISDRCIDIEIFDLDSNRPDDFSEIVIMKIFPINFESDTLDNLLPDNTELLLRNSDKEIFEICFPDCPLIDPNEQPFFEFGIVVYDDYCPVPLTDTLYIKISVEPPLNHSPILSVQNSETNYSIMVTEQSNGKLSLPIVGNDSDSDDLELIIIPINGFNPDLAGMSFSEPQYSKGNVTSIFNWNFDCNSNSSYEEGIDISTNTETRRLYTFLVVLEDLDQCNFNRSDTVVMDLTIRFPEEFPPIIQLVDEDSQLDYFVLSYDLYDNINLQIKALDGSPDKDKIRISAVGNNFNFFDYDVKFQGIENGIGEEPGSIANFNWYLDCSKFELIENDTFRVFFIAEDIDECNLNSADTLTIDFVINDNQNDPPEVYFENSNGDLLNDNQITFTYPDDLEYLIHVTDSETDSVYLELEKFPFQFSNYELLNTENYHSTVSEFKHDFSCDFLADNNKPREYLFTYIAYDNHCTGADTTKLDIKVSLLNSSTDDDSFLPPNVFTPNNDGVNDQFKMTMMDSNSGEMKNILPDDNCLYGDFQNIVILNRWGTKIFTSHDRYFQWEGENTTGVYFYIINYTNKSYKGVLTAL